MHVVAFAPISGHHLIAWLFIGLVAGALAGIVVRGGGLGFFRDIIVGLIGAVIGGLILHAARGGSHTWSSCGRRSWWRSLGRSSCCWSSRSSPEEAGPAPGGNGAHCAKGRDRCHGRRSPVGARRSSNLGG